MKRANTASVLVVMLVGHLSGCGNQAMHVEQDKRPSEKVVAREQEKPADIGPVAEDLAVAEPSPSAPVTASMACRPARVKGETTVELLVTVRIARAHYLHAEADHGGTFTPLGMEATLPAGIEFVGDWIFPPPEAGRAGVPVYRNSVLLRRSLRVAFPTLKTLSVTGILRYQACNDELCWPPGKMELSAPLSIQTEVTQ